MSVEKMKQEAKRKFHKYHKGKSPLHNPGDLHKCIKIEDTEEGDIRISFRKGKEGCEALKDRYKEILDLALKGGETIYTSL